MKTFLLREQQIATNANLKVKPPAETKSFWRNVQLHFSLSRKIANRVHWASLIKSYTLYACIPVVLDCIWIILGLLKFKNQIF